MNIQKIPVVAISLVAFVLLIIFGVYNTLREFQHRASHQAIDPFTLVPEDASLVFHIKNPALFLQSVTKTGPMADDLEALLSNGRGMPLLRVADSLLTHNEDAARIMGSVSAIVSQHRPTEGQAIAWLVNITATEQIHPSDIASFLKKYFYPGGYLGSENIAGNTIFLLQNAQQTQRVYYLIAHNNLLLSVDKNLLLEAVDGPQRETSITTEPGFAALRNTAGRFSDNLYLETSHLCQLLQELFPWKSPLDLPCNGFAGWQSWDISYNPGEIILNGFADPDRRNLSFLAQLAFQQSVKPTLLDKVPYNTGLLLYLGINDTEGFQPGSTPDGEQAQRTSKEYELRFMDVTSLDPDSIYSYWSGEIAMALFDSPQSVSPLLVLGCTQSTMLLNHPELSIFLRPVIDLPEGSPVVFEISIPGFFPSMTRGLVGEDMLFALFKEDHIVAANQVETLLDYQEKIGYGQHFLASDAAAQIQSLLPGQHTWLLHVSPAMATQLIPSLFSEAFNELDSLSENATARFSQLSAQIFPSTGNLFFSNAILRHQPGYVVSNPMAWETSLKAPVLLGPVSVINHNAPGAEIMLQDTLNNLYLLDLEGKILWEKEISGPIMSEIHQVDIYKNNRLQYLFNTRNFLHLIDRNGEYVRGFPMRLPAAASAGIAVFDYDSNKNYRIIFPAENLSIYNYTLARKPVSGWVYNKSENLVQRPVQHIRTAGKDFLFVTDTTGTFQILNRRGISRLHTRQKIKADPRIRIFASGQGQNAHFIIAGEQGEINQIGLDGNLITFQPDTFSLRYKFMHHNFSDNNEPDLIYLDNGILSVFNASGKRVMTIPVAANNGPYLLDVGEHGKFLGATDTIGKRLFLIDSQANIKPPFPVAGDTQFYMEKRSDGSWYIITGNGPSVICYMVSF